MQASVQEMLYICNTTKRDGWVQHVRVSGKLMAMVVAVCTVQ